MMRQQLRLAVAMLYSTVSSRRGQSNIFPFLEERLSHVDIEATVVFPTWHTHLGHFVLEFSVKSRNTKQELKRK